MIAQDHQPNPDTGRDSPLPLVNSDLQRASALIVDLHQFFSNWISGACANRAELLTAGVIRHLSPAFVGIMADGALITPAALEQWMGAVHATSPRFKIAIRNLAVRHRIGTVLVVTYEEWAHDAPLPPHSNARLSTVVLRDDSGDLKILHLQETWLQDEVVKGGDFNF
jgi:hypothetical protein